ncbi:phospholipase D/transphosphatidylase [Moraxella macacae 0408225]|uniref:Phospholipase D/transphosphatidylase n=1 Tax=Moraxella macacae 0408225 TaxID=1230338 RepID=L2F5N4_9GAMM|nr:phospholipase D family protein [Moraxella macacae]ELA08066.1 phospholipase D/transphosphatidylase [Moraxella macacae 0408225]
MNKLSPMMQPRLFLPILFTFFLPILVLLPVLSACQPLPKQPHLSVSTALTLTPTKNKQPNNQHLLTKISNTKPNHSELSGYYPIITSRDALASRSLLTNYAKHSIDIQYYIWNNDEAGQLMLKQLYDVANRGVKVRLLLDDLNTDGKLDQLLLAFSGHPNIAVRLINPKIIRAVRPINFVLGMPRYHRRMHNKSMTFDKQLSIIGGRNIGNEYLRSDTNNEFSDLDVLLAGKVVDSISESFERYWQSEMAYDIETLVYPYKMMNTTNPNAKNPSPKQRFLASLDKIYQPKLANPWLTSAKFYQLPNCQQNCSPNNELTKHTVKTAVSIDKLLITGKLPLRWKKIDFFADNVTKLTKKDDESSRLVTQLRNTIGTPKKKFTVISSYFVPTNQGVAELNQLVNDGVKVTVLTNSFDSTDVPIVHTGYSKARLLMLRAGVRLYELKSSADADLRIKKPSLRRNEISTSLHTKAFAVDDRLAFIGSYNVDPRSAHINTELGVVIYDSALAKALHAIFDDELLNVAYRLGFGADDQLVWQTLDEDTLALQKVVITKNNEPRLSLANNLWISVFSLLPIQWLL